MKISNAEGVEQNREAVLGFVNGAGAELPRFSFDAVRDALGCSAEELPDGWIHQICQDAGIAVVP